MIHTRNKINALTKYLLKKKKNLTVCDYKSFCLKKKYIAHLRYKSLLILLVL